MMTNGFRPKRSVKYPVTGPVTTRGMALAAEITATNKNVPPVSKAKSGLTSQSPPVPSPQKKNIKKTGASSGLSISLSVLFRRVATHLSMRVPEGSRSMLTPSFA